MTPTPDLFDSYFQEVNGVKPFPWQVRLAQRICTGEWPTPIALPTASGKTALIDIAVFALACAAPNAARRIFFVVDRRVVVDEAAERAAHLAACLRNALLHPDPSSAAWSVAEALHTLASDPHADPLRVATLRGGVLRNDSWADSPLQPLVCCSTVDQLGSSLLFRAYGSRSPYNWPIRSGLAANDAAVIVDEAHCSVPFVQTLESLARYRVWAEVPVGRTFNFVELSATPTRDASFALSQADWDDPVLGPRLRASKPARLIEPQADEQALEQRLIEEARAAAGRGAMVIGVVVNRVLRARRIFTALAKFGVGDTLLFTGRMRPWDRDRLWRQWRDLIRAGRTAEPEKPVFVVATQSIEVGANLDFDALVTEAASLDALRQRFGRLNRLGRPVAAQAAIVSYKEAIATKAQDAVYGTALTATWKWLRENAEVVQRKEGRKKVKEAFIDMGIEALQPKVSDRQAVAKLSAPTADAPVLLPAHLDRLVQTSPEPEPSPEVSLFLHGPASGPADVRIVWRADLPETDTSYWADIAAICAPSGMEAVSVPIWAARVWLEGQQAADISDVEGTAASERSASAGRPALVWKGPDESEVVHAKRLRPGMTMVVPAGYGGCDGWGWNPASPDPVSDVGDAVSLHCRGRVIWRRLPPALVSLLDREAIRKALAALSTDREASSETRLLARLLFRDRQFRIVIDPATADSASPRVAALVGSRRWRLGTNRGGEEDFYQESTRSAQTTEVPLDEHQPAVAARAEVFARACGLSERLVSTVAKAGALHDIGKADLRFQSWLRGGVPVPRASSVPLAKSGANANDRAAVERARRAAGYPKDGRHELQSVALLQAGGADLGEELDQELLLHLIASHHGRCRPFAPVVDDPNPVVVTHDLGGSPCVASSRHGLESFGSGTSERFWVLVRRYGWFGLAYLEALLRLADQRVSEEEQTAHTRREAGAHA